MTHVSAPNRPKDGRLGFGPKSATSTIPTSARRSPNAYIVLKIVASRNAASEPLRRNARRPLTRPSQNSKKAASSLRVNGRLPSGSPRTHKDGEPSSGHRRPARESGRTPGRTQQPTDTERQAGNRESHGGCPGSCVPSTVQAQRRTCPQTTHPSPQQSTPRATTQAASGLAARPTPGPWKCRSPNRAPSAGYASPAAQYRRPSPPTATAGSRQTAGQAHATCHHQPQHQCPSAQGLNRSSSDASIQHQMTTSATQAILSPIFPRFFGASRTPSISASQYPAGECP